jgi:formate hydrogenlyase subunit 3/multisubunit Na+/H+ antiporter MnhD subunit
MNPAQIHLALNHVPILILPTALALLLVGFLRRSRELTVAALVLAVLAALAVLPVYFSGEGAEELVEHQAGVLHDTIEEHEDAGKFALIAVLATGVLAMLTLLLGRGETAGRGRLLIVLVLIVGAWASAVGFRTGHLGGLIRHPEITTGAGATGGGEATEGGEHDRGDH